MFAVQKAAVREKCSRWRQVRWILSRNSGLILYSRFSPPLKRRRQTITYSVALIRETISDQLSAYTDHIYCQKWKDDSFLIPYSLPVSSVTTAIFEISLKHRSCCYTGVLALAILSTKSARVGVEFWGGRVRKLVSSIRWRHNVRTNYDVIKPRYYKAL